MRGLGVSRHDFQDMYFIDFFVNVNQEYVIIRYKFYYTRYDV